MASVFKRGGKGTYYVEYYDHTGKRRTIHTKYSNKDKAKRYAQMLENEAEDIRRGVADPKDLALAAHARRPLQEHFEDFLSHLQHSHSSAMHVKIRRSQLERIAKTIEATSLADVLDPNAIDRYLQGRAKASKSAATINRERAAIVAFVNWCITRGRVRSNPLTIIGKLNEDIDRRRERRALTTKELDAFLRVAQERDAELAGQFAPRFPVYLTAALTGLRRNELRALTWEDVDLERRTISIPAGKGKAKRDDIIPLHRQVVDVLRSIRPADGQGRVFSSVPTIRTVYKDLQRAGVAKQDANGRWADLHALRTTLGTALARSDVSPAEAQRLMRHGDYRTTLKHYTRLTLRDDAAAIDQLPDLLQHQLQQSECVAGASTCVGAQSNPDPVTRVDESKPLTLASLGGGVHSPCDAARAQRNAAKTGAISSVG